MMGFTAIIDFEATQVTLLDPKNKRFSTVSSAEYVAAVAKQAEVPPEVRKLIEAMKFNIETRATGRSDVIKTIQADERELIFTVETPTGPQGPGAIRLVYSFWAPRTDEFSRNPALREIAQYAARAYAGMNPAEMMQKMFAQVPGMSEKLRAMMEEFKNMQVMLRFRGAMYSPGMAAMIEQLRKAGKPVPEGVDPNAPVMEFAMDLEELSTAPIPDSTFQVPADYTAAPIDEVLKSVRPGVPGRQ
jgi:hypothetical protein